MVNEQPPIQQIQVPLVWIGLDETPIELASTFQVQIQAPGEIIVSVGQTAPPILTGTPEEQATQARAVRFVQSRTLARLVLTPHRVRELISVLQQVLEGHDKAFPR